MSLLGGANQSLNNISSKIKNPFEKRVISSIRDDDFIDGFQFEELTGPKKRVKLNGNLMPHVPFNFGGSQRMRKDYYAGQSEPTVHVLGPEESDLPVKGRFYDKGYDDEDLYGVATEIQQLCDSIRIRGNVVRIWMGEFQRYGILRECDFEMKGLGDISYTLTFDIIGFNAPINGKFIEKRKQVPFAIKNDLIALANDAQDLDNIPVTVPLSIADKINELVNTVASAINIVTDFVDNVIAVTNDIQKAVQRVFGLIKHAQNKIREYKNFLGSIDPFDPAQSLTGRYENASFYSSRFNSGTFLASILQKFKVQFLDLTDTLPLGRHFVREDETLQSISIKFYGNAEQWKTIYDHNNLSSADITTGQILEIPRI